MTTIPVALQLYSVREDCARDLLAVIKAVAEMGYEGVEFAGYYGYDAAFLRKLLDDHGLKVAGTHIGLDTLTGDNLKKTIEFNHELGNKYLIVPGLSGEHTDTKASWLRTAHTFNELAAQLRHEGQYVGYHNHTTEFSPLEGELPWDIFFGNTVQDVIMQFDTGNAMEGGTEPIQFLKAYPGRAVTIHIKECSKTDPNALIGDGDVPFSEVFATCEEQAATEWYIIEQETYKYPPMETVKRCLENFKKMR